MLIALSAVLAILSPAAAGTGLSATPADTSGQAGVKLTLNRAQYWTGDPVRVQVEAGEDGYLIVMRVDGDGRVRVVFPLDPDLDPFVRGGKRYDLRGRQANETFRADDLGGAGIVFAALSRDPLRFDEFAVGDHWDYEALRLGDLQDDPEAALHRFVRRMSGNGRYTFDVKGYRVLSSAVADRGYAPVYIGVRDPYHRCYTCGFGDPWYDGGVRVGVSIGIGSFRDPWDNWYDPYWYDPYWNGGYWYDPYWAYGASPWYPPYYPGQYAPYTVINNYRPRATPNPHAGERARPRAAIAPAIGTVSGVVPRRTATPPPVAPPSDARARPRTTQSGGGSSVGGGQTPPAGNPVPTSTAPGRAQPETRPVFLPGPPVGQGGSATGNGAGSGSSGRGTTSTGSAGSRARPGTQQSDRPTPQQGTVATPPATQGGTSVIRPDEVRPVFREPAPAKVTPPPDRRDPPTETRPVYREPTTSTGASPRAAPPTTSAPKQEPKPEQRRAPEPEKKTEPAAKAPASSTAPTRSSPPPPPPPPPTQSTSRARAGSGG